MKDFFTSIVSGIVSVVMAVTGFFSSEPVVVPVELVEEALDGYYYIDVLRDKNTEKLLVANPNGESSNLLDIHEYTTTNLAVERQLERKQQLGGVGVASGYVIDLVNSIDLIEKYEGRLGASGNEVPIVVALFETSLASSISSSAESMTLVSATDKAGTTLASSTYSFIIDEGSASEEFVLADCAGTACANMIRGLSPITGTTTVSSLQKAHRRGASVKITDGPQLLILSRIFQGRGYFQSLLRYDSAVSACSDNDHICDKAYIDGVAVAGASDSNETTKGILEQATGLEAASTTTSGDTTAPLALTTKYATSTPDTSATTPNHYVVVSQHDGYLDKNWFGRGINVGSTTPWQNSQVLIEQSDALYQFLIGDSGTTTPSFFVDGKGNVGIGTTTPLNPNFKLAVTGTTSTDGFFMKTNSGAGKVLTSNSNGSATWQLTGFSVASSTQSTQPSTAATTTRFRMQIPSGQWGPNSAVEIFLSGDTTSSANNKYIIAEIGTNGGTFSATHPMVNLVDCTDYVSHIYIGARGATNSQIYTGEGTNTAAGSCVKYSGYLSGELGSSAFQTSAIDLSTGIVEVLIRVRTESAGETFTIETITAKFIP